MHTTNIPAVTSAGALQYKTIWPVTHSRKERRFIHFNHYHSFDASVTEDNLNLFYGVSALIDINTTENPGRKLAEGSNYKTLIWSRYRKARALLGITISIILTQQSKITLDFYTALCFAKLNKYIKAYNVFWGFITENRFKDRSMPIRTWTGINSEQSQLSSLFSGSLSWQTVCLPISSLGYYQLQVRT